MKEIWKDVVGYEGLYQVSDQGRVKSLERPHNIRGTKKEKILECIFTKYGYYVVNLYKNGKSKIYRVHRLVLQVFCPIHNNKLQVNHINGVKTDNCLLNLEWCNTFQNMHHAYKLGLIKNIKKGESHYRSRLNENQVLDIRNLLLTTNFTQRAIAKMFNVSHLTISDIKHGKTWKHV